ncbi:nucleoside-diphosphate sugar epimerase [Clostridia bacterium]|nr:nucleoside-diphosphate sugar epimerase [Clostridia bacterium]
MLCLGRFRSFGIYRGDHVIIVGAGEAGVYAIHQCLSQSGYSPRAILLLDDDPNKQNLRIHGVKVRGSARDIDHLVQIYRDVREILIAIPSLKGEAYTNLITLCSETHCKVRILSPIADVPSEQPIGPAEHLSFRDLNVSDFLPRDEVELDVDNIRSYLTDKTVMVTGGGGSIGSEICRHVMRFAPKTLCIFDAYENNAYELQMELERANRLGTIIQVLIGSVRDDKRLRQVFREIAPDVVFHAAAHKHVPLMEDSPGEAIKNNIMGTRNVLQVASESGVERFVLLSTDKAVNPTNVMGATKRMCEILVQHYAHRTRMKCMAVRFGNVLGSHGSVIPLFESQIHDGGPVTVTHPDIERFFMTIREAAQLVLQAGGIAQNGAIFVLDMGRPVKIKELAEKMIASHGKVPGKDIQIQYTGLRPGEKLFEELWMEYEREHMQPTAHKKIYIAPQQVEDDVALMRNLEILERMSNHNTVEIKRCLSEIVLSYHQREEELLQEAAG